MSPAVEDFLSPSSSSTQRSYFQNPNPSAQKHPFNSGVFSNSFNLMNSSSVDFDCSNAATSASATASTVRSSRRKQVKVKKQSTGSDSVSAKPVNSTGNYTGFVFNANSNGSGLNLSLGQTGNGGNGEQQSNGVFLDSNMFRFTMGVSDDSKLRKTVSSEEVQNSDDKFQSGNINFVFGADEKADSRNVGEEGANKFGKPNGVDFVFGVKSNNGVMNSSSSSVDDNGSVGTMGRTGVDENKVNNSTSKDDSHLINSMSGLNLGSKGSGESEPLMNNNSKSEENNTSDSRRSENLDFVFSANPINIRTDSNSRKEESKENIKSGDSVNRNVDSGITFGNNTVNGVFHIGNQNEIRSSFKGSTQPDNGINNFKNQETGSSDYMKKQDNYKDPVLDGNYSFVFGSNIRNPSDETKTSNNTNKINDSDSNSCSNLNNFFVFGGDKRNILDGGIPADSKNGGFGTSFTGFNTPKINVSSSFTADMFPGLGMKLDFSKSKSVGQRKSKKKLKQQSRNYPNEVPQTVEESSECGSPMDVSPYTYETSKVENEDDDEDTTEELHAKNVSSSSATSSFAGADVAVKQRPNQKKYRLRTGRDSEFKTPKSRVDVSRARESTNREHSKATDQEICDNWRKRGNQAYKNGELSEAEVCYSKGIHSIQHTVTPGVIIEPLLLCYSNRAATRMALGRMREGLKDCRMAATLDPNFLKANLRSANCHLLLGEVEDAIYNYNKCLESGKTVCLDRRIAIEAADGLQKAQKVTEYIKLCSELLNQKTHESATNALENISYALSISCYSEKLLNLKGEALLVLGKHKEVVQLCEQSLELAEKNFTNGDDYNNLLKLWRWNLMVKSHFHLGKLEMALELIEKHEQLTPLTDRSKIVGREESLVSLAVTIRELLHCKNAGNEAFQNGKHSEAVEHYTAAISKSMESRAFAAVCFCNRAAAHQALGEIVDAIGDCSIAIALDESYPKALSRRATLWETIRDYKHAADDLQRLVSILEIQTRGNSQKSTTPGKSTNGSVKDLTRARRRISSIQEKAKKERSLDLYQILGLKSMDAATEVKKAYRKAALRHHPDKAGQVLARGESGSEQQWKAISESIQMDADKLFKMIGEAYAVLSDSTKRSKYDLEEEMWDDTDAHVASSSRRASDYYNSPYDSYNRRNSHDSSRKTYTNSRYYYWEDSRNTYHSSYPRW